MVIAADSPRAEPSSASGVAIGTDEVSRPSITRGASGPPSARAAASRMATRPPPCTMPGQLCSAAGASKRPRPSGARAAAAASAPATVISGAPACYTPRVSWRPPFYCPAPPRRNARDLGRRVAHEPAVPPGHAHELPLLHGHESLPPPAHPRAADGRRRGGRRARPGRLQPGRDSLPAPGGALGEPAGAGVLHATGRPAPGAFGGGPGVQPLHPPPCRAARRAGARLLRVLRGELHPHRGPVAGGAPGLGARHLRSLRPHVHRAGAAPRRSRAAAGQLSLV